MASGPSMRNRRPRTSPPTPMSRQPSACLRRGSRARCSRATFPASPSASSPIRSWSGRRASACRRRQQGADDAADEVPHGVAQQVVHRNGDHAAARAGQLRLDDPVSKYLPWFAVTPAEAEDPPITIEELLTHSSGLPREAGSHWTTFEFPTTEQLRKLMADGTRRIHPKCGGSIPTWRTRSPAW